MEQIEGQYGGSADSHGTVLPIQVNSSGETLADLSTTLDNTNDSITTYEAAVNMTVCDLSEDTDIVVTAAPALLMGVYVNVVLSAHVALVKDSSTTKITLPASLAAGTNLVTHGATFATNITIESDNAATGSITVYWRAI